MVRRDWGAYVDWPATHRWAQTPNYPDLHHRIDTRRPLRRWPSELMEAPLVAGCWLCLGIAKSASAVNPLQ